MIHELTKLFEAYNTLMPNQSIDKIEPNELYWRALQRVKDSA